jgi:cation diffusion facilitator family transporter
VKGERLVRYPRGHELPPEQERANKRAVRVEWISVAYWISVIAVLYFALGSSQAMKAAWVEDILALFPPLAFLVASRFRYREPNSRFPWGYHRAITVAYVVATTALFALGLFILVDSVHKLLAGTHPPIGMVEILEWQVWGGWVMIAALSYGVVPPFILGRLKQPLSAELHDKVLYADAKMNRADWLTAIAAMAGVIGIGFGLWWADAAAAIFISLDILHDGVRFLRESVADLMDDAPKKHDEEDPHPLIDDVKRTVMGTGWVSSAAVRLRENGHQLQGDVWVVPRDERELLTRIESLTATIRDLDWQLADVVVSPVRAIDGAPEGVVVRAAAPNPEPARSATAPPGGFRRGLARLLRRR